MQSADSTVNATETGIAVAFVVSNMVHTFTVIATWITSTIVYVGAGSPSVLTRVAVVTVAHCGNVTSAHARRIVGALELLFLSARAECFKSTVDASIS